MFLPYVESAEIRNLLFVGAPVVLKYGLGWNTNILANDLATCLLEGNCSRVSHWFIIHKRVIIKILHNIEPNIF
jgi:hypothetical protein